MPIRFPLLNWLNHVSSSRQANPLQQLIDLGTHWVVEVRNQHKPNGRTLSSTERRKFAPFFEPSILDSTRIVTVPQIPNPTFYPKLEPALRNSLMTSLNFSEMAAALTLIDTILISQMMVPAETKLGALLFHEHVHVVQYKILGLKEFVSQYLHGWNENGREYMRIPLEKDAYDLESRFSRAPHSEFSVAEEVRKKLKQTETAKRN